MQRLTSLCSVLNEMEPVRVVNHMFVPREVRSFSSFFLNSPLLLLSQQCFSLLEECLRQTMGVLRD